MNIHNYIDCIHTYNDIIFIVFRRIRLYYFRINLTVHHCLNKDNNKKKGGKYRIRGKRGKFRIRTKFKTKN